MLGCLLEKQRTTPDQYPLSLQRAPARLQPDDEPRPGRRYEEREIHEALQRLARRGWTRLASGPGSRAAKYRQLFDEALGLAPDETAVLCVLMLRGPQTPGELNQRTQRLHPFAGLDEVHADARAPRRRGLVERLDRRPGQKEERYRHLLGGEVEPEPPSASTSARAGPRGARRRARGRGRVSWLIEQPPPTADPAPDASAAALDPALDEHRPIDAYRPRSSALPATRLRWRSHAARGRRPHGAVRLVADRARAERRPGERDLVRLAVRRLERRLRRRRRRGRDDAASAQRGAVRSRACGTLARAVRRARRRRGTRAVAPRRPPQPPRRPARRAAAASPRSPRPTAPSRRAS